MDDIENVGDEEIGSELWEDNNCVCLVRDGLLESRLYEAFSSSSHDNCFNIFVKEQIMP